jgi:hypothetical protein
MLLLRNSLLKKVKQHDANLSIILQVYQVCRKYHHPLRSFKTFLQANLNFFLLLPQLTQPRNELQDVVGRFTQGWNGRDKIRFHDARQDSSKQGLEGG